MTDSPLASAEWLALVAAMRFAPDDDTPRLVAADWLQEQGRPELTAWGQFVGLQVEGARTKRDHPFTDSCDCAPCKCERKATHLFDLCGWHWRNATWGNDFAPVAPPLSQYRRGFVTGVTAVIGHRNVADVSPPIVWLFHRQPITRAECTLEMGGVPTQRYTLTVETEPSPVCAGMLRVRAELSLKYRSSSTVQQSRSAMTMQQFPKAVGGAIRHAVKGRHALFVGSSI
jgi:uncharacterized protein (TIGR02996 family)